MFKFRGVHHIAISVPDLVAAKKFYCEGLGLECVDQAELPPSPEAEQITTLKGAHSNVLMVRAGNIFLEIFEYLNPRGEGPAEPRVCDLGFTHFAFDVDDIEQAHAALAEAGVRWHCAPTSAGAGYMMAYGRDPFGNVIEIQQLADDYPYSFGCLTI
ncbi:MAG: VOC family protein [Cellvibrionaceae bacterium]|nr:VOC family protein [Cellvibrionaceae bacterium]